MRALAIVPAAFFLLLAHSAKAGTFLDLEGGLTTPVGDDDWNNTVEPSPKLAVHAGSVPNNLGGMVSVDWTPYNTDAQSDFPGIDIAANRFRILGNLVFQSPVKAKIMLTGRVGLGADIQHASADGTVFGVNFHTDDTDVGIGFELGAGVWVKVGSVALGGEIALPISHHDQDNPNGEIDFIYDTFDLDLLFGVRLISGN